MQVREKVGKSRNTVFPMICGSGGSKSRLAKAAGAEPAGQMRDEKLHAVVARSTFRIKNVQNTTPLWHEAHFEVKMYEAHHARTTFGSCDVEKVYAAEARSTLRSQKCTKHTRWGPLLEVAMSKKCTRYGAKRISKSLS